MTTPTPEELIAGRKLSDILGQLRGRAQDMENMYGRDFCLKESTAFWAAANLIESLSAQVAQLQGERAGERTVACPHWEPGTITMRKGCTACAANARAALGAATQPFELTLRENPKMPSDETLEQIASESIVGHWGGDVIAVANADQSEVDAVGYRAIWRHGCDAGMVAE